MRPLILSVFAIIFNFHITAQTIITSGASRNVMMGIDLSPTIKLDTILNKSGLYALGPIEDLQGEITVMNGKVNTSTITNGKISNLINPTVRAPFLVYSYVHDWESFEVKTTLSGLKSIENLIDSMAVKHGYGPDDAFPFLLESEWQQLHFHVIMRDTTELMHSHESHQAAKRKFVRTSTDASLLGFYSRHHEGVFTHRGQYVHVHYLNSENNETGHLDDLNHRGAIIIKLPAK